MIKCNNSILRVFKQFNSEDDLKSYLSNILDSEFVSDTLDESINSYFDNICNNINYKNMFYDIKDKVLNRLFNDNNIPSYHQDFDPKITFDGKTYLSIFNKDNVSLQEYNEFIDRCANSTIPSFNEYLAESIFLKSEGYKVVHEPNGKNECPDLKVIYPDGRETYIEIKSVLGGFYSDDKFHAKINNAMKGTDLILTDLREPENSKDNICDIHLRDITVIFYYYYCDPYNNKVYIFRTYVVPAPLTIDCEFNSDGTFKKLGLKSDNNFNTVLNLKLRTPFNKYNSLADRLSLITTGYTINGQRRLISNSEGDFYNKKKLFNDKLNFLYDVLSGTDYNQLYIIDLYNELKVYKYNTSKYALLTDKEYIKDVFKKLKKTIKSKFSNIKI